MYSFDVYDTLITRKVNEPHNIWDLMSHYISHHLDEWKLDYDFVSEFAFIREDSERQVRKSKTEEITLNEIYNAIDNNYNIGIALCDKLKDLEIKTEYENTVLINENIIRIKRMLSEGKKVILISDMYLPRAFFIKLFDKLCPLLNEIPLYLSSEIGKTKASGLLYKVVKISENVEFSDWTHEGDNIVSDYNIPQLFGIKTVLYSLKYDKSIIDRLHKASSHSNDLLTNVLCGYAKIIDSQKDVAYKVGYTVAGHILYTYVDWILKQAVGRGISHLYFIARDGFILKQIGEIIANTKGYDICMHYLYGSRSSWRIDESERKELLKKYLRQEICYDYKNVALVDTQGTGKSIEYLSDLCGYKFKVFYYALFGSINNRKITPICYMNGVGGSIIEVLCRAPHGSTIGYKVEDNHIVPMLDSIDRKSYEKSNWFSYLDGVLDFCRDFSDTERKYGIFNKKTLCNDLLSYCLTKADVTLANFLGQIPFDESNLNESSVYAPKLNKEQIYKIEVERTTENLSLFYKGDDLDISYARLSDNEKEYLDACRKEYLQEEIEKKLDAKKIIIYGFGKYGKDLYHRALKNENIKIVDVVDSNHNKFRNGELTVSPIKNIKLDQYDMIVITLYDNKVARQIKEMLVEAGVEAEKIIDIKEFNSLYSK